MKERVMAPSKIASKKKSVVSVSTSNASASETAETLPVPVLTPVSQTVAANPSATAQPSPAFLAKVAQATSLLDQAIALFQDGVDLTPLDRKRSQKLRKGGDRVIPILAQAAKQIGLSIPLAPVAPMEESLAEAQALLPVQTKIGVLQKQVGDHVFSAEGSSWGTATALYAVLRRLSKGNGQLAKLLEPAGEFFGYRHPSVRAEHPKTAKGKAALKEQKLQQAAAASSASEASAASETAESSGSAAVSPVVATSPIVAASSGASTNGALNGSAHS